MSLEEKIRYLYNQFGQRKPMGNPAPYTRAPHYFLLRAFLGENDLVIILNTKRCRYQCHFCQLPAKCSRAWIPDDDILAQFEYTLCEMKHALSILDRLTIANDGSVFDTETMPLEALLGIARCTHELRRVRTLVLETRLEFIDLYIIQQIQEAAPRVKVNILTGFETQDPYIREEILFMQEPIETFLAGLDIVAKAGAELTSYVLYKPSPTMTDHEAFVEAEKSIDYLVDECQRKEIPLTIRINPMYLARGSRWGELAKATPNYEPPRLTDIMRLAEKKAQQGVRVYIGLSTEGLEETGGTYHSREDYSSRLIKPVILLNDGKITSFDWEAITR